MLWPRLAFGAVSCLVAQVAAQCSNIQPSSSPVAASGVSYKVLMNGLGAPRHLVVDAQGNLLISEQAGRGIRRVVLTKTEGINVCVQSNSQLIANAALNHGIALSQDGATLFASSASDVIAYPYNAQQGTVGTPKTIITGMRQGSHSTRTLLVPNRNPNLLIVSRGSDGNVDAATTDVNSGRSQIRTFAIDRLMAGSAPAQYTSGATLAWGLRNSVGVAEDPSTGNVWSVENSLDNMRRLGQDIHNSNPGEELNFHGNPSTTNSEVYGKNYGYPNCVAIWDPAVVQSYANGAATGKQMTGEHSTAQTNDNYCQQQTVAPRLTFGSHLAPLDVRFQENGRSAFISMHGSWNRSPADGYRVSRIAFSNGQPTAASTSRDAEVPLLWNSNTSSCPNRCFRPTGLAIDGSGRLFMTSDSSGELFVLTGVQL